jgi:hypothetical protein
MNTNITRILSVGLVALGSTIACTEPNPNYCLEQSECESGYVCDPGNRCVPGPNLGSDANVPFDGAAIPDAGGGDIPDARGESVDSAVPNVSLVLTTTAPPLTNVNVPLAISPMGGALAPPYSLRVNGEVAAQVPGNTFLWVPPMDGTFELQVVGNLGGIAIESNVISVSVDKTPPTPLAFVPANGGTQVPLNQAISASFSEPVVWDASLVKVKTGGVELPITATPGEEGRAVQLAVTDVSSLQVPGNPAATVTVDLPVIRDLAGNQASLPPWSFTYVAPEAKLVATLNTPSGTVYTNGNVAFQATISGPPLKAVLLLNREIPIQSPNTGSFTLNTATLAERSYELSVRVIAGTQAVTLGPVTVVVDRTAPMITRQTPAPGAQNQLVAAPVVLEASEPLVTNVGALGITVGGQKVAGTTARLEDSNKRIVVETGGLAAVTLPAQGTFTSGAITDRAGNALSVPAWSWSYPVWIQRSVIDTAAPSVAFNEKMDLARNGDDLYWVASGTTTPIVRKGSVAGTWQALPAPPAASQYSATINHRLLVDEGALLLAFVGDAGWIETREFVNGSWLSLADIGWFYAVTTFDFAISDGTPMLAWAEYDGDRKWIIGTGRRSGNAWLRESPGPGEDVYATQIFGDQSSLMVFSFSGCDIFKRNITWAQTDFRTTAQCAAVTRSAAIDYFVIESGGLLSSSRDNYSQKVAFGGAGFELRTAACGDKSTAIRGNSVAIYEPGANVPRIQAIDGASAAAAIFSKDCKLLVAARASADNTVRLFESNR